MKVHWMSNTSDNTVEGIRKFSKELDEIGYYSVLLTYDSKDPDRWIKAAHVLDTEQKIKYMPAIRTYSMSPEYCVMMSRAFNEIQKNRLMLNIIPGNLTPGENSINNTIYLSEKINSREKILEYTDEWVKKFTELYTYRDRPELGVSGHSKKSVEIAKKYADYHLTAYNHLQDFACKKNIVCAPVVIGNNRSKIESIIREKTKI